MMIYAHKITAATPLINNFCSGILQLAVLVNTLEKIVEYYSDSSICIFRLQHDLNKKNKLYSQDESYKIYIKERKKLIEELEAQPGVKELFKKINDIREDLISLIPSPNFIENANRYPKDEYFFIILTLKYVINDLVKQTVIFEKILTKESLLDTNDIYTSYINQIVSMISNLDRSNHILNQFISFFVLNQKTGLVYAVNEFFTKNNLTPVSIPLLNKSEETLWLQEFFEKVAILKNK